LVERFGLGELLKTRVQFIGCKGEITSVEEFIRMVKELESKHDVLIQLLNADLVFGFVHLVSAKEHAIRAFEEEENICDTLPMEIMLYASGEVQIKMALEKMGLKKGSQSMVMILEGEIDKDIVLKSLDLKESENAFDPDLSKIGLFGIRDTMVSKRDEVINSVLEKVALVDLKK
jgi:tRNA threonylcarbamoyladenosine modification (KEOPS) complex Cgi121 subunit